MHPVLLDMRAVCGFCDYFVIMHGTSNTHVRAIAESVRTELEKEKIRPLSNLPSQDASGWIVLDYSGVVVHIFSEQVREFYALERLWADAKKVRASSRKRAVAV